MIENVTMIMNDTLFIRFTVNTEQDMMENVKEYVCEVKPGETRQNRSLSSLPTYQVEHKVKINKSAAQYNHAGS